MSNAYAVAQNIVSLFVKFESKKLDADAARIVLCNETTAILGVPNDNAAPAWSDYEPFRVNFVKGYMESEGVERPSAVTAWARFYRECGYKKMPVSTAPDATKKADTKAKIVESYASVSDDELAELLDINAGAIADAFGNPECKDLALGEQLTKKRQEISKEKARRESIAKANESKARKAELENETVEQKAARSALVTQARTADIQDVQRALKVFERMSKAA